MPRRHFSGAKLRKARTDAGLRIEALATAVDRSASVLRGYEHGTSQPPVIVLLALADALGVELDALLTDDPVREVSHA